ncbi:MAG: LTA synthase family protein [Clostridiales bacterium]|jgi:phosphoglycerol transferase MdoB-like AlkP superfamily enzyme|nr:LTA synthase family protein [Clostridiales bacterium]
MTKLKFTRPLVPHLFLLAGALAASSVVFLQAPDFAGEIIAHVRQNPQVFFFEFLFALIVAYFFYYASGQVWIGIAVPSLLIFIVCVVHKYKVYLRGDPFMPADIILGGEVVNISRTSSITLGPGSIALLALILLANAAVLIFARFPRVRPRVRLCGLFLCAVAAAASFFSIYTNDAVYASIPIKNNAFNMVNEFNSKGFLFAFLYHTKDLRLGALKPEGYSADRAREILARYEDRGGSQTAGGETPTADDETPTQPSDSSASDPSASDSPAPGSFTPDVIFWMSEAFWDVTQIPSLSFPEDTDPVANFHRLERESLSGDFYPSVYGGGTDMTEFNVLTGHAAANFNTDVSSAYKFLIRRDTDSIVRSFARAGYSTLALHPGYAWFYNRVNVYPWLGFERFISIDDFDAARDVSGNYVSDQATTDKLLAAYEEYTRADTGVDVGKPFFNYTVSIQNHGPYDAGFMYGQMPQNYIAAPGTEIDAKSHYAITNYVRGLQDADASLGRLVEYFEGAARPVVLVFFGDHLPGLGSNYAAFHALGYPIGLEGGLAEKINVYQGRYLIWANDAARAQWPAYETLRRTSRRMSANYLGLYVLEKLGLTDDPYQNLVGALREALPVYHPMFYGTDEADGAELFERAKSGLPDSLPGGAADLAADYKIAQYYKLFDEKW